MRVPTLILLPGLHGTADLFHPLTAVIPREFPTRILTHPTDRCLGYRALQRNVEAQIENETDIILFAESFSGGIAVEIAARHPTRVRALVLCGSFVTPPVPRILCYLATPLILLRVPIPTVAIRTFLSGFRAPRALVRETRAAIGRNRTLVLAHRVQSAAWINAQRALKECTVPILCLAGTRDRLIGRRSTRRIRRIRPDVPVKSFDAPHLLLQTRPAEIWTAVTGFLRSQGIIPDP